MLQYFHLLYRWLAGKTKFLYQLAVAGNLGSTKKFRGLLFLYPMTKKALRPMLCESDREKFTSNFSDTLRV
ncbi:hypothetical protein DSM110093_02625 [Sulfitobacter sp. DSM 110093]|nr:hypothetical protein DSM110093_02625 [Sulfitobacter sp. DSM 110093]